MGVKEIEFAKQFLNAYNNCFMLRDLEALRKLYIDDGYFIYFDNHAGCDSHTLSDHLSKVGEFFKVGAIVDLDTQVLECIVQKDSALTSSPACWR